MSVELTEDEIYSHAADFIAFFEGFVSVARWDVNHYRLGFGSDTEGPDQVNVVKGMTTTRSRALMNLAKRVPIYKDTIVRQIGPEGWRTLPASAKVALLDFAYNYGDLTPTVAAKAVTGDLAAEVLAVEAREGDNREVNAKRRHAEAALIASGL